MLTDDGQVAPCINPPNMPQQLNAIHIWHHDVLCIMEVFFSHQIDTQNKEQTGKSESLKECRAQKPKSPKADHNQSLTVKTRLKVPGAFDLSISNASIPLSASVTINR